MFHDSLLCSISLQLDDEPKNPIWPDKLLSHIKYVGGGGGGQGDGKQDLNVGGEQERNSKRKAFVIFFTAYDPLKNTVIYMRENENSSSS